MCVSIVTSLGGDMHSYERLLVKTVTYRTRIPAVAKVRPTVLVVTDLEGYPRLMIFISSEKVYATSY